MNDKEDIDIEETQEWQEALESVIAVHGLERAHFLLEKMISQARQNGAYLPYSANTAYLNTILPSQEQKSPGDYEAEAKIRSLVRWNALAMVVRANRKPGDLGGHIASFASSAVLYDVGFNNFFRAALSNAPDAAKNYGDMVYFQGHSAPGVYARAFLEGRITEEQLENFRSETQGGLPSYPHPWLMPDFWQFPTVSMGLGPIMAIYQARFMRYLENRELIPASDRKVWAFMGDGEMDEPESLGAISLATREQLDNLIFVVNCNLQRLDGPVRGNGKIIQELEAVFRGAGWNVIKVIWGSYWDPLLYQDKKGLLKTRMEEALDGDYQTYRANSGAYIREHFFGAHPELKAMVANMTDDDIWRLNRGGHDPHKVYAAFHSAFYHTGQPTVILAKTIKGYGMGDAGEARNIAHQQKKISNEALCRVRDRFRIPLSNEEVANVPFYRPSDDSPEMKYLKSRITEMGGGVPQRKRRVAQSLPTPSLSTFSALLEDTKEREISTTMAFVRILSVLVRDKSIGRYMVPIVADESRTFGMEGMFRQLGIYSRLGQLYRPEDADQMMFYREDKKGQILQEGINEAGAMSSWMAAATAYSNYGAQMLPFYIFYSMFGFQRIGDLAWAAGDMRARGFLLGATSGRTTLNGEGLQHEDGHSQIQAQLIPNCRSYDPSFACELAVIMQNGIQAMLAEQQDVFYYITLMNENYRHIALPVKSEADIIKGLHRIIKSGTKKPKARARLLGSGAILQEAIAAAKLLEDDFGVATEVYSATSFNILARDGQDCARWNMLNSDQKPRASHVETMLGADNSPIVAATDYIRMYADQIRAFVAAPYVVLGTDGFGRSDTRANLRRHFEVDRYAIAYAALSALVSDKQLPAKVAMQAAKKYKINLEAANPIGR